MLSNDMVKIQPHKICKLLYENNVGKQFSKEVDNKYNKYGVGTMNVLMI